MTGYVGEEYKTEAKDIPYYEIVVIPVNKDGQYKETDELVTYAYRKQRFNISVDKQIVGITINHREQKIGDGKLAKIEIPSLQMETAEVKVRYKIIVKNTEEVAGETEIIEHLPEAFKVTEMSLLDWEKKDENTLSKKVELQAGETKEIELELEWKHEENNLGVKSNIVELTNLSNKPNYEETTKEDNQSKADIIISIKTGDLLKIDLSIGLLVVIIIELLILQDRQRKKYHKKMCEHMNYKKQ